MKKSITMIMISASILCAQSLQELYGEVANSPLYKSRAETIEAQRQSAAAERYEDGWSMSAEVGGAFPKDGSSSGGEFSLSIGKEFTLQHSVLGAFLRQNGEYAKLGKTVEINRIKGRIFRVYGEYCIQKEALKAQKSLAAVYKEMLKQIDTGVRFGEFDSSKALMAHLALENLNLKIVETQSLLSSLRSDISSVVFFDGEAVCNSLEYDMNYLLNPANSAFRPMLEMGRKRAKEAMALSRSRIPKLGVSASYSDEIDTRRTMLGISIPLAIGNRNEAQRSAALHAYEAARSEMEALNRAYESASGALSERLSLYSTKVQMFESSINLTTDTLIEQSRLRFKAGEESLLSMLKAAETKLQMIETLIALKIKRHDAVAQFIDRYAIDPEGVTK